MIENLGSTPTLSIFQKSIQYIKGVGPKRALFFKKLNIETINDALFFLPRRYEDRAHLKNISELKAGELQTFVAKILVKDISLTRTRRKIFKIVVGDDTGHLMLKWFNFNERYLSNRYKKGQRIIVSGQVLLDNYDGFGLEVRHPDIEILDSETPELVHLGRIVPIYPLTEGFYQKTIRSVMKIVVDSYAHLYPEILPDYIIKSRSLIPLDKALREIHFPSQESDISLLNNGKTSAHQRIIFNELFLLELGLALKKRDILNEKRGISYESKNTLTNRLKSILPFELTPSQEKVLKEIYEDMKRPYPMNRLLQGDVGCGKTVVALMAMLRAIENGYQGAIMVPTEILAEQHYFNIKTISKRLGIEAALLTSGVKGKKRKEILEEIFNGKKDIIIGTHALIQEDVRFKKLGLVVVDEQHKFGVMQRASLKKKGYNPDVLVMTATPIPRTLALTVYGDLDISIIDEMPQNRLNVITKGFYDNKRREVYTFIRQEIEKGRQAYIVFPLVEESENSDLKAATEMASHLKEEIFPDFKIGLLHGRMKSEEKEEIMKKFKEREIDILVSTTVVEVGMDISNASVMIIEHAERFGLSQLHQMRGRVGRGPYQSYCILMIKFPVTEEGKRRLKTIRETTDGFIIAEKDLEIRGPGEFFGTRQSGLPELIYANIIRDHKILEEARKEAFELIAKDPFLKDPSLKFLKESLKQKWKERLELVSIG
ncbi:MAG TPA: ATP-dependent DNA helicase RecG [Nitrospinota bacterium]|nr:ATP-dependent DNA helicase RecG [Nitrospinota bacterium]